MAIVGVNDRGLRVGQDHQNAVLTDREVELMLELRAQGCGYALLVEKFDCSKTQVSRICNGKQRSQTVASWRKVEVA